MNAAGAGNVQVSETDIILFTFFNLDRTAEFRNLARKNKQPRTLLENKR